MNIKRNEKYISNIAGVKIRVEKIVYKSFSGWQWNKVRIVSLDNRNRAIRGSSRIILQDSIRRKYSAY